MLILSIVVPNLFQTSNQGGADMFDKEVVIRQLRSLQVLETVHLMAGG